MTQTNTKLPRPDELAALRQTLREQPITILFGAPQMGCSWLARHILQTQPHAPAPPHTNPALHDLQHDPDLLAALLESLRDHPETIFAPGRTPTPLLLIDNAPGAQLDQLLRTLLDTLAPYRQDERALPTILITSDHRPSAQITGDHRSAAHALIASLPLRQLQAQEARELLGAALTAPRRPILDHPRVTTLLAHLDYAPGALLAIAPRLERLDPEQILARLDQHFDALLGIDLRDQPAPDNLRLRFRRAFAQLDERSQEIARRCEVFAGNFSLEDAEAIIDDGEGFLLDELDRLVASGLLHEPREGLYRPDHRARRILELSAPRSLLRRHREHYLQPTHDDPGPELREGLRDNHLQIIEQAERDQDHEVLARAALALLRGQRRVGPYRWLHQHLLRALHHHQHLPLALHAELLGRRGELERAMGETGQARETLEQAITLLEQSEAEDDELLRLRAGIHMAALLTASLQRDFMPAWSHGERAEAIYKQLGDHEGLSFLYGALGNTGVRAEDLQRAIDYYHAALRQPMLEQRHYPTTQANLGGALFKAGRRLEALHHIRKAAEGYRQTGDDKGLASAHNNLAHILLESSQTQEEAAELLTESVAIAERLGLAKTHAIGLHLQGCYYLLCAQPRRAHDLMMKATEICITGGYDELRLDLRFFLAAAASSLGASSEAESLLREIEATIPSRPPSLLRGLERDHLMLTALLAIHRGQRPDPQALQLARLLIESDESEGSPIFARILIRQAQGAQLLPGSEDSDPLLVLYLSEDRKWVCRSTDDEPIDLRRRGTARKLLMALIEQHERAPGEPMQAFELFEAAWPGDESWATSGLNRVYTAIHRLRDLLLDDLLLTLDEGYCLDPNTALLTMPPQS